MAYVAPTVRSVGDAVTAADYNIMANDVIDLRSYSNRYARVKRTSGTITLSSNAVWANVDTGLDLTLNAITGDVIEYAISAVASNTAVETYFDVVTIVAGNPVNSFGFDTTPANPPTNYGVQAWLCPSSIISPISGSAFRTLVSGDISSGTVTLRLRFANSSATTRPLNAGTPQPLEIWARNHGPVTT